MDDHTLVHQRFHTKSTGFCGLLLFRPTGRGAQGYSSVIRQTERRDVDDKTTENEREVLVRFDAMTAWVEHAKAGECPISIAHEAIGELHRACETYLYGKAA